jgi:hypothetical protein
MHPELDALGHALRHAEQLDPVAEALRVADVSLGELRDPLRVGLAELHRDAEGERCEDRELVRGIDTLDVEGRIGLRIAACLGFAQHHVEREPPIAHLGKDEVRGAVDDPRDPLDAIRRQPLAHRLDDGDAARDGRLEADHDPVRLRRGEYLRAVQREERLVRGDDVLAVAERPQHQILRHGVATDELDDDVDLRARDDTERIRNHARRPAGQPPGLLDVLVGDHRDADLASGAAADLLAIPREDVPGAAAHRADSEQPYVDWLHFLELWSTVV